MKIKYFDKAIEIMFIASMFWIPIIFDRRIGIVFSGTKSAFLRAILILIIAIWVSKQLLGGKHIFKRTVLDWPIIAYMLIISAATISSVHPLVSFWGFYGRYEGLVTWFCYAALFFIVTNYFAGWRNGQKIIAVVIPAGTIMASYGIIQRYAWDPYAWGGVHTQDRVIATIGQPNFLAAYVIMVFFLGLCFYMLDEKRKEPEKVAAKKTEKGVKAAAKTAEPAAWYYDLLPLLYFLMVPLIFIVTIFSQNGINVIFWYLSFFAMTAFACLFAYNFEKLPKIVLDILILCSLGLSYICLFYTQSRGGYMGFMVGGVLFIILMPKRIFFEKWKKLLVLLLIIGSITIFTESSPFSRFSSEVKIEKSDQQLQAPSPKLTEDAATNKAGSKSKIELSGAAGSRIETWTSAAGVISENPVFGIGPEVLKMVFPRYETDLFRFKEAFHVKQDRCHNETFDVPVTKGLVGFFVYVLILFMIFRSGIVRSRKLDDNGKVMVAALLSAMAAYLIQNQFSFGVIAITSIFWVIWGMVLNVEAKPEPRSEEPERAVTMDNIPWIPLALVIAAALFLIFFSFQQFMADLYFKTGKSLSDTGNLSLSIPELEKSIKVFPYEGGTITHYGIAMLNQSQRETPAESAKSLSKAIDIFVFGMKTDPYNADNFYITSRIYLMRGDINRSIEYANKALKIDPYYAEAHLSLAEAYGRLAKGSEAQKHYNLANKINPNLAEPKIRIGWKLIEADKLDEAFKLFQDMLVSDPRNADVHNALGAIYLKRGDRVRAKEEFNQSLAFDPNNQYANKMLQWLK